MGLRFLKENIFFRFKIFFRKYIMLSDIHIIDNYFTEVNLQKSKVVNKETSAKDPNYHRPMYIVLLRKGLKNNMVFVK